MPTPKKLTITVVAADQGDLREYSARSDKLHSQIADLEPGQAKWRRNVKDNRHRLIGRDPVTGSGFVLIPEYDPADLTSTFLRGSRLLTSLNAELGKPVLEHAEARVAARTARTKKGGK